VLVVCICTCRTPESLGSAYTHTHTDWIKPQRDPRYEPSSETQGLIVGQGKVGTREKQMGKGRLFLAPLSAPGSPRMDMNGTPPPPLPLSVTHSVRGKGEKGVSLNFEAAYFQHVILYYSIESPSSHDQERSRALLWRQRPLWKWV